jgi:two-component system, OmpR family, phosphate regulon response regulator PhoB
LISTTQVLASDSMGKPRVLIVEDDRALSDILFYNLQKEGYNTFRAFDGREAIEQARLKQPDIVILDLMLPLVDGLEVCRQIRKYPATAGAGILMLTAKTEEMDQLIGFSAGADDYVNKPYSMRVLLERIRALYRRNSVPEVENDTDEVIERAGVRIDMRRHQAYVNDQPVELTPSEFKLLESLIREPGRAYDRNELIASALGGDTLVLERTIDVHIRALRKKLGDLADLIETVRGVGYRFKE